VRGPEVTAGNQINLLRGLIALKLREAHLLLSDWLPPGLLGRVSISIEPGAESGGLTTGIPDQGGRDWVG